MKEFVHTFSGITYLSVQERDQLFVIYSDDIFFNGKENEWIFHKYTENGLRIYITYCNPKERKYDKEHRAYKAELIVTPAKLIYPDDGMKKLLIPEEYSLAMEKLKEILREIQLKTEIDLWKEAKLKRVDLSRDIETESDEYSMEVIRLSKLALHKTGYHLWVPKKEDIERTGWKEEDSAMFYNHNREVQAKIYNKLKDFKNVVSVEGMGGLLRFELSLKRNFLKNSGLIQKGNTPFEILPEVFSCILNGAEELMQTHIVGALWSGNFLSKRLQTKYIKRHCKNKESKKEKMLKYRDECKGGILIAGGRVVDYFEEIELSPLCTGKEFSYIPSFARLLGGEENAEIKRFVERQIQKKL